MNHEALVALTTNAIAYGVMSALEGREELLGKLRAAGSSATMFDIMKSDAESFLVTRADLVEALGDES